MNIDQASACSSEHLGLFLIFRESAKLVQMILPVPILKFCLGICTYRIAALSSGCFPSLDFAIYPVEEYRTMIVTGLQHLCGHTNAVFATNIHWKQTAVGMAVNRRCGVSHMYTEAPHVHRGKYSGKHKYALEGTKLLRMPSEDCKVRICNAFRRPQEVHQIYSRLQLMTKRPSPKNHPEAFEPGKLRVLVGLCLSGEL